MRKRVIRWIGIGSLIPVVFGLFVMAAKAPRMRERELVIACWKGDADQVHRLLESGVNPNAIVRPDIDNYFNWLVHETLDPQDRNIFRTPALYAAGFSNKTEIIDDLLAHGADPNFRAADGGTALIMATDKGNEAAVRHLLNHGADPKLAWKDGTTPLDEAKSDRIRSMLKEKGA
jgi:ankyrin repeat protein